MGTRKTHRRYWSQGVQSPRKFDAEVSSHFAKKYFLMDQILIIFTGIHSEWSKRGTIRLAFV